MTLRTVKLTQAFSSLDKYWSPRVGGDINCFQISRVSTIYAVHESRWARQI